METNKLNVEVKKINNKTKQIEWTETIQIEYEPKSNSSDNKSFIQEEKHNLNNLKTEESFSFKNNYDKTEENFSLKNNPFHQPNMNTIEFNCSETTIIANIMKYDSTNLVSKDEELLAIEKLLERKIITKEEFEEKRKIILEKN